MNYRKEVDGLRAIAVIPVIFFHAGFDAFSGGFVGVDVFFVISGYLITSIILSEQERGTFSIVNFYERRARRILPALFVVMLVSIPFAWLWLRPSDLKDFSQSLIGVSVFSSNILFWLESGYFEAAAELKPLLHTWSLAVEEQYYVLFPLFLMMVWSVRKRWILAALTIVGLASLAFAQWSANNQPTAGFFLLPARAWELMVGACVAFLLMYGKQYTERVFRSRALCELAGIIGIGLLTYSIAEFDETVPFPSVWALVPTLGTALLILFATSKTTIGHVLGNRVFVAVGLVSYSAYLWHQPLFAFARHRSLVEPGGLTFIGLSLLAVLLAFISWQFVERPFRSKGLVGRGVVFTSAIVGSLFFIAIGLLGHLSNGFEARKGNRGVLLAELDDRIRPNYGLSRSCEGAVDLSPECRTSEEPEILLWGDSFAMHLVQGVLASNPSARLIQMTKSVCGPFFGLAPTNKQYPVSWAKECLDFNRAVKDYIKSNESIRYVVLASPFIQYVPGDYKLFMDGVVHNQDAKVVFEKFSDTLKTLDNMGVSPVIFAPTPSRGTDIGQCLVKASYFSDDLDACNFPLSDLERQKADVYDFLSEIAARYPVVWLNKLVCSGGVCFAHQDSTFLYRDRHHFSHEGSALLGISENFYRLITDQAWRMESPAFR